MDTGRQICIIVRCYEKADIVYGAHTSIEKYLQRPKHYPFIKGQGHNECAKLYAYFDVFCTFAYIIACDTLKRNGL